MCNNYRSPDYSGRSGARIDAAQPGVAHIYLCLTYALLLNNCPSENEKMGLKLPSTARLPLTGGGGT